MLDLIHDHYNIILSWQTDHESLSQCLRMQLIAIVAIDQLHNSMRSLDLSIASQFLAIARRRAGPGPRNHIAFQS